MLGAKAARNYLVLIQNSAEVRATGGLPGALAVLRFDNGTVQLAAQSSGKSLGAFTPQVDVDPAQRAIYTDRLGTFISDVNLTPDFPTAARSAKEMWEVRHNTVIDGVIALDPTVLAHILEASGPISMAGDPKLSAAGLPPALDASNVVRTLLSDVYTRLEGTEIQDAYFESAAQKIFQSLASGKAPGDKLIQALMRSSDEHRLYVWSDHKEEQEVLRTTSVGGAISGPRTMGASFGVYFNDGTGAKMDYYVKRTVQLVENCSKDEHSQVTIRVTTTNTAPLDAATSLPATVTGGGVYGVPAGIAQSNVIVYGPAGSGVETARQDGKEVSFGAQRHDDRPVGSLTVRLAPGQSSTVEFTFGKIEQHRQPEVVVTPTIESLDNVLLPMEIANCGSAG
ncbi:hypothetical protein GCM10027405_11100 [Arthrobacter alkaliphilus]